MIKLMWDRRDNMTGKKVLNFITSTIKYSYRGLFSTIYFIFRKKNKIDEMFELDTENQVNMNVNDVFVKKEKSQFDEIKNELYDKISFRYKAKKSNGKIINGTFDAYNI